MDEQQGGNTAPDADRAGAVEAGARNPAADTGGTPAFLAGAGSLTEAGAQGAEETTGGTPVLLAGAGSAGLPGGVVRPKLREDLMVLMKVRLNAFVLITAFFGFLLAVLRMAGGWSGWRELPAVFDGWRLLHTLIGVAAAAFGSAAFNQLMEVDLDARMKRTAGRPLPARRMDPLVAFGVGWVLSAVGIIHLAAKVSDVAAYLTAATLALYVFVYTPLKRFSALNTLVGAVPGAVPPVIGWVAGGGSLGWEALFLFGLMFFWQLPHFMAINWICREEYEQAGYKMWSNGDVTGKRTALLAAVFSLVLVAFSVIPYAAGFAGLVWLIGGVACGLVMVVLAARFRRDATAAAARRLFLYTLLYLPLAFALLALGWR